MHLSRRLAAKKSAFLRQRVRLPLTMNATLSNATPSSQVMYDITWMAYCGEEVPAPMREAFAVLVLMADPKDSGTSAKALKPDGHDTHLMVL